jgi:hypothetical protein
MRMEGILNAHSFSSFSLVFWIFPSRFFGEQKIFCYGIHERKISITLNNKCVMCNNIVGLNSNKQPTARSVTSEKGQALCHTRN